MVRIILCVCLVVVCFGRVPFKVDGDELHPNVLLIIVDDLNDWVGCLGGHPQARTPASCLKTLIVRVRYVVRLAHQFCPDSILTQPASTNSLPAI